MYTALSVTSLWMKRTCPGPPGEYKMRQWLTRVICGPFSSSCRRIKEFSPVRRTWLGSVSGIRDLLRNKDGLVVGHYNTRIWPSPHLLRQRGRPQRPPQDVLPVSWGHLCTHPTV